ncbi:MAG: hypothetical protein ACLR6J_12345 [Parabacteroides merdae]
MGGQYVRFEAEVGIDDTSSGGSVFFQVLNTVPDLCGGRIEQQVSGEIRYAGSGTGRPGYLVDHPRCLSRKAGCG